MSTPLLVKARSERKARAYRYTGFGVQPVGPVGCQACLSAATAASSDAATRTRARTP